MSSIGTGYDLSVTTFSPDGRVFQIEYAAKAVDNSGTVIGIKCKDGIVLGVEKLITSKMMLPGSNRRIHSVHRHSGMAVAGLAADGRQIVARAKSEATNYESVYGEPIPVKELADRVASYVHLCTLYWWLRPFGCGVILGGYDRDGPQLYMVEPSGVSYRYFGAAIGKGRQAAKTYVKSGHYDRRISLKSYFPTITNMVLILTSQLSACPWAITSQPDLSLHSYSCLHGKFKQHVLTQDYFHVFISENLFLVWMGTKNLIVSVLTVVRSNVMKS
ncbi:hypothetical protein I3760_09G160400 [Carya illinoinensis]|nr:hypothetical protein I3760_09G160400 [Carya illinoinensis]KAG2689870.1 hypothetical protein I3760_09G160400 [Carya illinoinensis]